MTMLATIALNGFNILFLGQSLSVDMVPPSLPMVLWIVVDNLQDSPFFYLPLLSYMSMGYGSWLLNDFIKEIVKDCLYSDFQNHSYKTDLNIKQPMSS